MIIKFDPTKIQNIAKYFNEQIQKNKTQKYIMFIFQDIYNDLKDQKQFYQKYQDLLKRFDLPYAFYPYYIHFNKVLKSTLSFNNPKMRVEISGVPAFDVVNQTAYGMMIIDVEKLNKINFKFNEIFNKCFYIQNLIQECFNNNLYFSTSWFFDVYQSFDLLKSNLKDGYLIDVKTFTEEKTKFFNMYKSKQQNVKEFIDKLNARCKLIKQNETKSVKEQNK